MLTKATRPRPSTGLGTNELARIEAKLRAEIGDAAFDAIPDAKPKRTTTGGLHLPGYGGLLSRRRQPRSADRQRSIERRRRLSVVAMPPHLAAHFTTSELAALLVIGSEAIKGCCTLHIGATAARAGCGRTTVQNAVRQASKLGLIEVRERRRRGQKSLTNVIRIISKEWRLWLTRGSGFKKVNTTDISTDKPKPTAGFGAQWQRHYRHYDPGERKAEPPSRRQAVSR